MTRVENAVIKSREPVSVQGLSITGSSLPPRPGYGTSGKAIVLRANYFHMLPNPNQSLYRYAVDFSPVVDSKERIKRRLFEILLDTPTFAAMRTKVATDYSANLVTATKLNLGPDETKIAPIKYTEVDDDPLRPRDQEYKVKIQLSGVHSTTELLEYLASTDGGRTYGDKEETVQVLNIVMSRVANVHPGVAPRPRRNKYFIAGQGAANYDLRGGLIALRGYYASVRTATLRVLLNVNVCTAAFYRAGLLVQLMNEFFASLGGVNGYSLGELHKFLRLVRVETDHIRNKNNQQLRKRKTILGLALSPKYGNPDQVTFKWVKDNAPPQNVSVTTYFAKQYNRTLQSRTLPVVNVGTKEKPVYLPPEVCRVLPGQAAKGALTAAQTSEMIRFAARKPAENANLIATEGAKLLGVGVGNDGEFTPFGIKVRAEMITVPGRILNAPNLSYANGTIVPSDGSWNMVSKKFSAGVAIKDWAYLNVILGQGPAVNKEDIDKFVTSLNNCGLQATKPAGGYSVALPAGGSEVEKAALTSIFHKISQQASIKMILIILPNADTGRYARIKWLCDTQFGIHNVCVVGSKFSKQQGQPMYMANVAHKFNLKRGGANQTLTAEKLGILQDGKTMVVGIDVTHPSPGSLKNAPSIAGVVASVDRRYSQWPASLCIQESRKEMVTNLENMMVDRLRLWQKKNQNALPQRILVYRDGVSEGQYNIVLEQELPCIQSAIKRLYANNAPKPKISIMVVGKRHHTRFYPTRDGETDRVGNPKNGTVVDRGVTSERQWDFFLQAHTGLQGTARPAHYIVLRDENGLGADGLEQLTHNLCYMFGRATKSVSICPPAYYADLLCERGRCYLHDAFTGAGGSTSSKGTEFDHARSPWKSGVHKNLEESMFYI